MPLYTSYQCKRCRKEMILLTDEIQATWREGRYLACPHCGYKGLKKDIGSDDLRDCMRARSYVRNKRGALEQR